MGFYEGIWYPTDRHWYATRRTHCLFFSCFLFINYVSYLPSLGNEKEGKANGITGMRNETNVHFVRIPHLFFSGFSFVLLLHVVPRCSFPISTLQLLMFAVLPCRDVVVDEGGGKFAFTWCVGSGSNRD